MTPDDPATADESIDIYCTGVNESDVFVPRVVIGGRIAAILSVSKATDGRGATVLRVRVPRGVAPGRAVPVRLFHMDRPSNNVIIAVH